jgi:hypothetical protein
MGIFKHALAGLAATVGMTGAVVGIGTLTSAATAAPTTAKVDFSQGGGGCGWGGGWRCWGGGWGRGHHGGHGRQRVKLHINIHNNNENENDNEAEADAVALNVNRGLPFANGQ